MSPFPRTSTSGVAGHLQEGAARSVRNVALTAGMAVTLLLMSRWIDQPLAHALAKGVGKPTVRLFDRIDDLAHSGFIVLLAMVAYGLAIAGLRYDWRCPLRAGYERMARAGTLLLGVLAIGGLITLVLKWLVSRARPEELFERGFHGLGVPFSGDPFDSFPSSHAFTAFAVAAVVGELAPRWRWPVLVLAGLVAAGRLVTLNHYLSDVTAAAFLALMVAHYLAPYVLGAQYRWMLRASLPRRNAI